MLDVMNIRKDFPMIQSENKKNHIYFDNAATSFKPQTVIDKVVEYYTSLNSNIHRGDYDISFQVSKEYEEVRELTRQFLNAKSTNEIVFTNGASSALNLVAYGYGQKFLKEGDIILSTEAEHASNILPWFKVAEVTKAKIEYIPLNEDGSFDIENLKSMMKENVKIITLAHISNVMGYIMPMKEIVEIAHEYGALVVCDGAQSVPHIKTDVRDLDIDFLCFSSHKMLGPSGVGVLYAKYDLLEKMDPFMLGGGSNARFDICGNILLKNPPYKFEAGTPCIEGILGFGEALKYLMNIGMENIEKYDHYLHKYFMNKINKLENVEVYNTSCKTSIITFNVKGIFAQDVAGYLNSKGISVRSGNHCAKILLNLIGVSETIRASLYLYNTTEEIDYFIDVLKDVTLEKCIGAAI